MISNNMFEGYGDVLCPVEVKAILGIGRNTVYKYLKEGTIRSIRIAGKYRVPKEYLAEFIYPDYKEDDEKNNKSDIDNDENEDDDVEEE